MMKDIYKLKNFGFGIGFLGKNSFGGTLTKTKRLLKSPNRDSSRILYYKIIV